MDKLKLTIERRPTWPEVQMFFNSSATRAPDEHVIQVRTAYSFLPQSYLRMMAAWDGLDINWFVFLGSGQSRYPGVGKVSESLRGRFDMITAFPFAENAGGDPLFLHSNGVIYQYSIDGFEPRRLTSDFDTLMSEGFFGPNYTQILHGREWLPTDDRSWVGYLKKAGWY